MLHVLILSVLFCSYHRQQKPNRQKRSYPTYLITFYQSSTTKATSEVPTQCLLISPIFPNTQTPLRGIPKFSWKRAVLCSALMHPPTSPALASWKRLCGVSALRGCSANTVIRRLLSLLLAHLLPKRYGFCTEVLQKDQEKNAFVFS